jgi:hypothetical protein
VENEKYQRTNDLDKKSILLDICENVNKKPITWENNIISVEKILKKDADPDRSG